MSDQPVVLPMPGHAELRLTTRAGRVAVTAEERPDVLIESDGPLEDRVEADATGRISVRSPWGGSARLDVRCPAGTDLVVGTVAGKVELRGQLGTVRVTTVSGSVEIDRAEEVDVRTVAGNIEVARSAGRCRLQTTSGRATCGSAGDAEMSTMSGQIRLDGATGSVRAHSASGKVEVGIRGQGDVAVQTMSGSVRVEVPQGLRPAMRLKSLVGRPRCECEEGDDCRITVQSLSGKIEVVCAS
ncbi:MAG: hypothetical protein A2148_07015 [Chloroflexi bacterium RBG_16_68_14]|nr:MAG: hypothetical protein A2148_07015 [Chloroflexi bacterium RBG_16_68_14]